MTRFLSLVILAACLAAPLAAPPALAQASLAEAQQMGLVGERSDGLVGIVTASPSQELQAMVDDINTQRLERYRAIAAETSSPLAAVQARAGKQITSRVPAGGYVMGEDGRWTQK